MSDFFEEQRKTQLYFNDVKNSLMSNGVVDFALVYPTLDEFAEYFSSQSNAVLFGVNRKHKQLMLNRFYDMTCLCDPLMGVQAAQEYGLYLKTNYEIALVCYKAECKILLFCIKKVDSDDGGFVGFFNNLNTRQAIKRERKFNDHYVTSLNRLIFNYMPPSDLAKAIEIEMNDLLKAGEVENAFSLNKYIKLGDIFVYTQHYRTYCYQVVGLKGNNYVMLREISYSIDNSDVKRKIEGGRAYCTVGAKPLFDNFVDDKLVTKKIDIEQIKYDLSQNKRASVYIDSVKQSYAFTHYSSKKFATRSFICRLDYDYNYDCSIYSGSRGCLDACDKLDKHGD